MITRGHPLQPVAGRAYLRFAVLLAAMQAAAGVIDMSACAAWKAEVLRRQVAERGEPTDHPYDSDALSERKHKPFLRVEGATAIALVGLGAITGVAGDKIHPMSSSEDPAIIHWIDTIWIENQDSVIIGMRRLSPLEASPAMLSMPIPNGTTSMTAYEHCNKHGVWRGQTISIAPVQTVASYDPFCDVITCGTLAAEPSVCLAHIAEYGRLHLADLQRADAVDGNTNPKHKPSLNVHGNGSATVVVGQDNVGIDGSITYHPMVPSENENIVHWINAVWVKDQSGTVIAMHEFLPTDPSPATFTFEVPAGATKLTAFEYCNKHGLYRGDEVPVVVGAASTLAAPTICSINECPQEPVHLAREVDCLAFVADAKRRQQELNTGSAVGFPVPYAAGSDNEKHNPYIVLDGPVAKVVVGKGAATGSAGDPVHPMTDDPSNYGTYLHYIESIWVEDQSGDILAFRSLSPSEASPASIHFDIPEGTTSVRAYEFCNKHGLFQGDVVAVAVNNTQVGARSGCSMQQCIEGAGVSACQAFTAEFFRRQDSAIGKTDPARKHEPFLMLSGSTATIVVGEGAADPNGTGLIHPMSASSDPDTVHFISHIFARDDMGNLVALCELLPTDLAPAACTFQVPPGVRFLRPFEFCNKHGLYVGQAVTVVQSNPEASPICMKRECTEAQPSLSNTSLSSSAVDAILQSQTASIQRVSTINMCREHRALFAVRASAVDEALSSQMSQLAAEGDAASDTSRRLGAYRTLIPALKARGGRWYGLPEVFDHAGLNGTSLRLDLIDKELVRFQYRFLPPGQEALVDGIDDPIRDASGSLLLIEAFFAMNWGYPLTQALGAHYTIFYRPDFQAEVVEVALCAKTFGWMGIGWLTPDHMGHYMNYTDMVVAFVRDGQAHVQDRFAFRTEEPVKDESLPRQKLDQDGEWSNGVNDLTLIPGSLGVEGKEWCPDSTCSVGFSLVQFNRSFRTGDSWDAVLPQVGTKIGLIYAFSSLDPTDLMMVEHIMSTTGYNDLMWNRVCEPGQYFNDDRMECISCDRGSCRPASASTSKCISCPMGTYQDETGQSTCKSCTVNFTTNGIGATAVTSCTCSGPVVGNTDGWYHVPTVGVGECRHCPGGMTCAGGFELYPEIEGNASAMQQIDDYCISLEFPRSSTCTPRDFCNEYLGDESCRHSQPKLRVGYSSLVEDPLTVFLCKERIACPGGEPGTCAPRRDTMLEACAMCVPNSYVSGGECKECDGVSVLPFVFLVFGSAGSLAAIAFAVNKKIFMRAGASTTTGIMVGTMFGALQTLTTFASLEITWIEPMKTGLMVLSLFAFDLEFVRVSCLMTQTPYTSFLERVLVQPACMVFLALILALKKYFQPTMRFKVDVANTIGFIVQLFFIPICLSFLAPFICYQHPSGLSSMISAPSILCYEDDGHDVMIVIGSTAFAFLILPFLAFVIYGVVRYKNDVSRQDVDALNMYRFLFLRFNPEAYGYGLILLARNLAVCLVPIFTGKDAALQVIILMMVLLFFLMVQLWFKPWRPDPSRLLVLDANVIDATLSSGCIMLLLCGALTTDYRASQESVQYIGICVFIIFVLVVSITLAFALYQRFVPYPFYKWFITHHKADAAAQTRLVQCLLSAKVGCLVFIDSDFLTDLDTLFDTVRTRTGTLVVYATRDVLKRPWCAGEIVVASKMGVKMVLVECVSFASPSEEELNNLADYMDPSRTIISSYGISLNDVSDSYRHLTDTTRVPCFTPPEDLPGRLKYSKVVDFVIAGNMHWQGSHRSESISPRFFLSSEKAEDFLGTVVMSADPSDDEAVAATGILALKVNAQLSFRFAGTEVKQALCNLVDYQNISDQVFSQPWSVEAVEIANAIGDVVVSSNALLVMLSRNTMHSATQAIAIMEAMTVIAEWGAVADFAPSKSYDNRGGSKLYDGIPEPTRGGRTASKEMSSMTVVPISLPNFEFPSTVDYDNALAHLWPGSDGEEARIAMQLFFKRIALPFGTHASDTMLTAQATHILTRIPHNGRKTPQVQRKSKHVRVSVLKPDLKLPESRGHELMDISRL